jgi:hypothetical protein
VKDAGLFEGGAKRAKFLGCALRAACTSNENRNFNAANSKSLPEESFCDIERSEKSFSPAEIPEGTS